MEIKRFLTILKGKLWVCLVITLFLGVGTGVYAMLTDEPSYKADSSIYILNKSKILTQRGFVTSGEIDLSRKIVQDYADIILTNRILTPVVMKLKYLNISEDSLRDIMDIQVKKDSSIIKITVTWGNPTIAKYILTELRESFINQIVQITNIDNVNLIDEVNIVSNTGGNARNIKLAVTGAASGILLSLLLVYIIALFDNKLRREDELTLLGVDIIGRVPYNSTK